MEYVEGVVGIVEIGKGLFNFLVPNRTLKIVNTRRKTIMIIVRLLFSPEEVVYIPECSIMKIILCDLLHDVEVIIYEKINGNWEKLAWWGYTLSWGDYVINILDDHVRLRNDVLENLSWEEADRWIESKKRE